MSSIVLSALPVLIPSVFPMAPSQAVVSPVRRQWQPTPVVLPGKSHRRSLVGHSPWGCLESDTTERLHFHFSLFTFMRWRRKWQPTTVFLPGESQGWGSLVRCCLWGRTESDMTEATQQQQQSSFLFCKLNKVSYYFLLQERLNLVYYNGLLSLVEASVLCCLWNTDDSFHFSQ